MEQDTVASTHLGRLTMGSGTRAEGKVVERVLGKPVIGHRVGRIGNTEGLEPVLRHES
jgi:hypothetical protein